MKKQTVLNNDEYKRLLQLWGAVMFQAFKDINSNNLARQIPIAKWIIENPKDFEEVCDLANFNPSFIRKYIEQKLDLKKYASMKVKNVISKNISHYKLPFIDTKKSISFLYQNTEFICLFFQGELYFDLNAINLQFHLFKIFDNQNVVRLFHLNNCVDPDNLKRLMRRNTN